MDELSYWRLSEWLTVRQAACLITGRVPHSPGLSDGIEEREVSAVEKALRAAVLHGKVLGTISFPVEVAEPGESMPIHLRFAGRRALQPWVDPDDRWDEYATRCDFYVVDTPDWDRTLILVESIRAWLERRGYRAPFFFPEGEASKPGYLDPQHPRYPAKLAAAVAAWVAVDDPGKTSPKQALIKWLNEHAREYGLTGDDGLPVSETVENIAKIANWQTKGGAPKSSGQVALKLSAKLPANTPAGSDDDTPF